MYWKQHKPNTTDSWLHNVRQLIASRERCPCIILCANYQYKYLFDGSLTRVVCVQMSQLVGTTVSEKIPISSVSISPLADLPKIQRRKYEGICPSCNTFKKLTHTLNRTAAAVAILADAAALLQFELRGVGLCKEAPCSFRVCHLC